jgi:hypothetical protein
VEAEQSGSDGERDSLLPDHWVNFSPAFYQGGHFFHKAQKSILAATERWIRPGK